MQTFNNVDLNETMDIDEKFKRRAIHEQLIQKLEDQPETIKLQQFLKFERLNLKSSLFINSQKTDKIFTDLNVHPPKPKLDF